MNSRNTTRRRRTISIVSSLPPPTAVVNYPTRAVVVPAFPRRQPAAKTYGAVGHMSTGGQVVQLTGAPKPIVVRVRRRAWIPPQTVVRVDRPANAPPVGVPTRPVVVRQFPRPTINWRIVQPPIALRRISAVPNPTPPPPPHPIGGVSPPFIRVIRRPQTVPPRSIPTVVRSRPNIPGPTRSIVVGRYPGVSRITSPRVVTSGQVYLRSESAIYKAIVVPRFPARKPVPVSLDRTTYLSPSDPALLQRVYQRVVNRFAPKAIRTPIVTHTGLPLARRYTVAVTGRFVQRRAVPPRIVTPPMPATLRLSQLNSQPKYVQVVRRPRVPYPSILVRTVSNNQTTGFDPVVVRRFPGPFVVGRPAINHPYRPARFMGLLEDTRREPHDPVVVSLNATIASVSRRRSSWPRTTIVRPYMYTGAPPTPTPGPQGIWFDIIAASIDWLRQSAAIVSCFGDVKGTADKFASDAEPPGIDPPYAVFHEPEEVESFETTNGIAVSSLVDGVYRVEVFGTGKLLTRRLSEAVADRLNDAPLLFTNGDLIYLRRSARKYPTLEVPGTGTNVAMFKRMVEFEYQFERTYSLGIGGGCDG